MPETTKSGIQSPAGYNGKEPGSLKAPVKIYPGSSKIGHGGGHPSIASPAKTKK